MRLINNCGLLCLLFVWGCQIDFKETITDTEETFHGIGEIYVQGGSLEVSYKGGDVDGVHVLAYLESSKGDSEGIRITKNGNRLEVIVKGSTSFSFWNWANRKGYVHITGPRDMDLEIKNSSGTIEVENVKSPRLSFGISSGKMDISRIESDLLTIRGSSGKITARSIEGDVDVKISSGLAKVSEVQGNVNFHGSSGSVSIEDVDGRVDGSIRSGKASLTKVHELGSLSLSSGLLSADQVGFGPDTQLEGSSGLFRIKTHSALEDYNFDFRVGSGMLTIGNANYTSNAFVNHGSKTTIKGKINSGKMEIN
ncbi:DUF4097 family beta strand repeat-containing protein [Pleomorphovibrio marinus]|uniref:DUF4097 family beta strand repeat-containing protein n=1 Tax=Pleomorphovibrio marinus TaxID=2164132 RepID=UPI000E0AC6A8|nr:DUF4097 family beta strand repeat-containing protein [Pleomorphovibrio marinus]